MDPTPEPAKHYREIHPFYGARTCAFSKTPTITVGTEKWELTLGSAPTGAKRRLSTPSLREAFNVPGPVGEVATQVGGAMPADLLHMANGALPTTSGASRPRPHSAQAPRPQNTEAIGIGLVMRTQ